MATTRRRPLRWGALMGVASAIRSATRPGSPGLGERLAAVPRMVRAVLTRKYTGLAGKHLLLMLAAVGYVISPIDLIPEAIFLIAGLGDDALVVGWLAVTVINATDDFLDWEARRDAVPGQVVGEESADSRGTGGAAPGRTRHYDVVG